MFSRLLLGAVLTLASPSLALAKTKGPTLQDRQQHACYNDVQRLCGDAIPDVAKVTACMKDKRPLVSKKCSEMWDISK